MSSPASRGIKMSHIYRLGKVAIGKIMRYQKPPFKRSTAHKSTPTTKRVKKPHRYKLFPSLTWAQNHITLPSYRRIKYLLHDVLLIYNIFGNYPVACSSLAASIYRLFSVFGIEYPSRLIPLFTLERNMGSPYSRSRGQSLHLVGAAILSSCGTFGCTMLLSAFWPFDS